MPAGCRGHLVGKKLLEMFVTLLSLKCVFFARLMIVDIFLKRTG